VSGQHLIPKEWFSKILRLHLNGIIKAHLYNDHGWQLYEVVGLNVPAKHCSRWDLLVDRAAGMQQESQFAAIKPD
jgi:hypothetical protein